MKVSWRLEHLEKGQGRSIICRFGGKKVGIKFDGMVQF